MTALPFPLPSHLPQSEAIDPFALEPGVLLFGGRFCVVEPVAFGGESWSVVVSDVEREVGQAPHHRLRLTHLPLVGTRAAKLRLTSAVDDSLQEAVHHWVQQPSGTLLITATRRQDPLPDPLSASDAAVLASALADLLQRLHDAGVVGIRFSRHNLHLTPAGPSISGFDHTLADGTAADDVVALVNLIRGFESATLEQALRSPPATARSLYDRMRAAHRRPVPSPLQARLPARPPFVARETALRAMLRHFEAARRGEAQVIGLVGAAGSGKSRMLEQTADELARYAPCTCISVGLHSSRSSRERGITGVLAQLARDVLRGPPDERARIASAITEAAGPMTSLVASLSPGLATLLDTHVSPPPLHVDEQFVRHASTLAEVLRAIGTAGRPLVLLLDDAHTLGKADRAIVRFLIDDDTNHHTLVVLCSRAPIPSELDAVIPTLYPLEPFNTSEIERLLAASLSPAVDARRELAQALWQHTRGVPLTLWATIQTWVEEGYLAYRPDRRTWFLEGTPRTLTGVVDLFRHHFRRLSLDARYVALLITISKRTITERWLCEVTLWDEERVQRAAHDLLARGIAVQSSDRTISMPHGALTEMVIDSSGQRRERSAHRHIARWLQTQNGAAATEIAWHEEHATEPGVSEPIARWHMQAGQQLMAVYNLQRARWHYEHARARTADPSRDVEAVEGLADIALLIGNADTALELYLDATHRSGDTERALQIASKAVYGLYRRGASRAALVLGNAALHQAGEPTPTPGLFAAIAALRSLVLFRWLRSSLNEAERDALCKLYPVLIAIVTTVAPSLVLLYVVRGSIQARDLDSPNAGTAHIFAAQGLAMVGNLFPRVRRRERRAIERATQIAERHDDPWTFGVLHHVRSIIEFNDGSWRAAQTSVDQALAQFARSGDMTIGVLSILLRVMHTYNTNPVPQSLHWAQRAEVLAVRQRAQDFACNAGALRAVLLARLNDPSAEPLVDSLAARLDMIEEASIAYSLANGYLAEAMWQLGRFQQALEYANVACAGVGRLPTMSFMLDPFLTRLEILLSLSTARPSEYWRLRREVTLVRFQVRKAPSALARWRLLAGRAALLAGRPDKARRHLEHVIATVSVHRQTQAAMQAHVLLAGLADATDPVNADAHRFAAVRIAHQLGLPSPNPEDDVDEELPATEPLPDVSSVPSSVVTPIQAVAGPLLPALQETLPSTVAFTSRFEDGVGFSGNADRFQLLMVNMVFAARDLLSGSGALSLEIRGEELAEDIAAQLSPSSASVSLTIEVAVSGATQDTENMGGWAVCEEIASALGGIVRLTPVEESVRLIAHLPHASPGTGPLPPRDSRFADDRPVMVVVHPDARTRSTVGASIQQLGFICIERTSVDELTAEDIADAVCLFADAETWEPVTRRAECAVVKLIPRGVVPPVDQLALRVPFVFGDLADIVDSLGLMET